MVISPHKKFNLKVKKLSELALRHLDVDFNTFDVLFIGSFVVSINYRINGNKQSINLPFKVKL